MKNRRAGKRKQHLIINLVVILVVLAAVSLTMGRYPISLREVGGILTSKWFHTEPFWTATQQSLLLNHRLPRILLACMIGASLAGAGAAYQGVFQNPMASPDLLGASSGAAFGAALALLLHQNHAAVTLWAFAGGILTVLLVLYTGTKTGGRRSLGLILAGILIGSLVSSGTSFIKLAADPQDQLPAITYWLMGSLNGTDMHTVLITALPLAIGLAVLLVLRWKINLLTLSEEEALTMGIPVGRLRTIVILCATLITAASVSAAGVIGWIGLVVPHAARKLGGDNYDTLLPVSLLCGAVFLLLVDDLSRCLLASEIPVGILTSLLGAPLFLILVTREERK